MERIKKPTSRLRNRLAIALAACGFALIGIGVLLGIHTGLPYFGAGAFLLFGSLLALRA